LIAGAARAGTKLNIWDSGEENLNEFAVNEIEKTGGYINHLKIRKSVNLCRMIAKAKKVHLYELMPSNYKEIK
jgi:hypothetical protein